MTPISNPYEISSTKVACEYDLFQNHQKESSSLDRRMLQRGIRGRETTWFEDMRRKEWIRMIILDALEINIYREIDGDQIDLDERFDWDIIQYTSKVLVLQLSIENPEKVGSSLAFKDFISVTFWGVDFFKSS